uniref:Mediator of RNA polymerase II transcription subunit 21 n=1 Tax=Micromonas pusilla TaxID=38833 RepID=A0A7S0IIQ5_MICPS|mmetsp:Transcript_7492/g.30926  ORF Transcript_7492/g.30926 Transcript_7492/m.30926 type:complete len:144 (+) Transcript_7492:37-468(+)
MADIVTQLQDSVNELNGMFYNCIGVLQRDAKPAGTTADGELSDALPDDGREASEKQIKEMAAAVVQQSRKIDELASLLPEVDLDEHAQLGRIAELQAENDELDRELAQELEASENILAKATAAFEAATDKVLLSEDQPSTTGR